VVNVLPDFVNEHPKVRLVVLDSVTFHFRQGFQDMAQRTRLLAQMAAKLMALAERRSLAVVLVNQITTKVAADGGVGSTRAKLVPALGESWAHMATSRLILFWSGEQRYAHLHKSPSRPAATVPYFVTAAGIRGTPVDEIGAAPEEAGSIPTPHDGGGRLGGRQRLPDGSSVSPLHKRPWEEEEEEGMPADKHPPSQHVLRHPE